MISCVGRSGNLTFGVKRHAINSSSHVFNSGFWIVSLPWSSAIKVFVESDPPAITVFVSSYVSGMKDTVGIRTMKTVAGFSPSLSPYTNPMDDVSYPRQEFENMTTCYDYFKPVTEVLVEWDNRLA